MNRFTLSLARLVVVVGLIALTFLKSDQIYAAADWCDSVANVSASPSFDNIYASGAEDSITITIPVNSEITNQDYHVCAFWRRDYLGESPIVERVDGATSMKFTLNDPKIFTINDSNVTDITHDFYLYGGVSGCGAYTDRGDNACKIGSITITNDNYKCTKQATLTQERTLTTDEGEEVTKECSDACLDTSGPIKVELNNVIDLSSGEVVTSANDLTLKANTTGKQTVNLGTSDPESGTYTWSWHPTENGSYGIKFSDTRFNSKFVRDACSFSDNDILISSGSCPAETCGAAGSNNDSIYIDNEFKLCNQIPEGDARVACEACANKSKIGDKEYVWTAVGCISKNPEDIIAKFIEIGIGLGGGIALLMIIAGGFMLTISQGNPQKTNEAKEMITSAIIGLLFVLFSVVILQFIGVTIFHIPGFGEEVPTSEVTE